MTKENTGTCLANVGLLPPGEDAYAKHYTCGLPLDGDGDCARGHRWAGSTEEQCGMTVHGFVCTLPKGHNIGSVDIPENHAIGKGAPADA